ncbi:MAG: peptide-methionine (S)-S-oxide reductase MsrA [Gemmatimonadaceae bacterium]|nr:peptide-methionine (S)-S-oxide reductase MsrA [Gemmatimonadaceae bacterium]
MRIGHQIRGPRGPGPATPKPTAGTKSHPASPNDAAPPSSPHAALATFGAGCFWGVEQILSRLPGVTGTAVGYMGGGICAPTDEQPCSDTTRRAEVVQVTFDPAMLPYEQLIDVFWRLHDPAQVNREGPDIGRQARSVAYTHDAEQEHIARATFWTGEAYHLQYFDRRGVEGCHLYPAWERAKDRAHADPDRNPVTVHTTGIR